jgi:hypothetical protein
MPIRRLIERPQRSADASALLKVANFLVWAEDHLSDQSEEFRNRFATTTPP